MSKPRKAEPITMWLDVPAGPPHAKQRAAVVAEMTSHPREKVRLLLDPEEAATLGRRLLDWASRADVVTAVNAVGAVIREDRR